MQNIISIQTTFNQKPYLLVYTEDFGSSTLEELTDTSPSKINSLIEKFKVEHHNPEKYTIIPTTQMFGLDDEISYMDFLLSVDMDLNKFLNEMCTTLEEIETKRQELGVNQNARSSN